MSAHFQTRQLFLIFLLNTYKCLNNTWRKEIGPNGEDIWLSNSYFIPQEQVSYGNITLGEVMSAEFDFIWKGRSNYPREGFFENFFRIGFDAKLGEDCSGEGARYPSFWLTNDADTMHVSVSTGDKCQPFQSLSGYGTIVIDVLYHVKIAFNNTQTVVEVSGGGKADWNQTWTRDPIPAQYLGQKVPIWWHSNKFKTSQYIFNVGNGLFSNVIITSAIWPTSSPTTDPTTEPTAPTTQPTVYPTTNPPTAVPTSNPTTTLPTSHPTTALPTSHPTTALPTSNPSTIPTVTPSAHPSISPTTTNPSATPSVSPSVAPTAHPSTTPITHIPTTALRTTINPSVSPSVTPSISPSTSTPSVTPSTNPTTYAPITTPSLTPTTTTPTKTPSFTPTTNVPTTNPSVSPTLTGQTQSPSTTPTTQPSHTPSVSPTTAVPTTDQPSSSPSSDPSMTPSTQPSTAPSTPPTTSNPTSSPSIHPTHEPSTNPTETPTSHPTTDTPSQQPSNHPTTSPSDNTNSPSSNPSTTPTHIPSTKPTIEPTIQPTIHPLTITQTVQTTQENDDYDLRDISTQNTDFWNQNPYTYVFYGAIIFTAFLLIAMAIVCYCKFKPPTDDEDSKLSVEYHWDATGQTVSQAGPHIKDGYDSGKRNKANKNKTHGHTESHQRLNESGTLPSEDLLIVPHTNPELQGGPSGSQTSDEDVLKGAYGGHITAGGDDVEDPFPRDKLRTINDNKQHHDHDHNGFRNFMALPMDLQQRESSDRGLDFTEEDYEVSYEEEEYGDNAYQAGAYQAETYTMEDYDEDESGLGGHETIGGPADYHNNRHHVTGDEQRILETITKAQLMRKMVTDRNDGIGNDEQYAQHIFEHHQQDTATMDDIIHQIDDDNGYEDNSYNDNGYDDNGYEYHQ